ncbi:MAG TPA: DUF420 domain-containing protein [Chitinophagaceae bacterium]|jgi:putative membrane protein|nr:DUF420 domain-containing protein [Chitinophagaceae bacterium]HAN39774.1 DUF420 domain-containing protein [Chitinophagaceae bacterium]
MSQQLLPPALQKNDTKAAWLIGIFSVVVFAVVVTLGRVQLKVDVGFDVHIFAQINALINTIIAVLLVAALIAVKQGKYILHKKMMMTALVLSVLFLVSYIAHHLLAGEAKFGDANHDGIVSEEEKLAVGSMRMLYLALLLTHIFLAAVILPFILYTAYRALTSEFQKHKTLAKYTWPLWLYVAITGPIVYWFISPYYQ